MPEPTFAVQNQDALRQVQNPLRMPGGPMEMQIDPRLATLVYPLHQGWMAHEQHTCITNDVSINGALVVFDIEGGTGGTFTWIGGPPLNTQWRVYDRIFFRILGGAVTPIEVAFQFIQAGTVYELFRFSVVNPSGIDGLYDTRIVVPPTVNLRARTNTNGGAGDTVSLHASCRAAIEGVEIPAI